MFKMGSAVLLIFLLCDSVLTYNILAVFPHNGKSHFYFFQPLLKGLAKYGHNVTVLSHFPQINVSRNYRDVSLMNPKLFHSTALELDMNDLSDFSKIINLLHAGQKMCESGLTAPSVTEFLKENNYFDLVLVEYFVSSCYLGFAHKYKAPVIGLSSTIMLPWQSEDMGNPSNPAYVPCISVSASDKMSFLQKVESTVKSIGVSYIYRRYISNNNQPIAEKVFGKDLPSVLDISKNTSLLFLNTYISTSRPKPLVPGIIEIGGIHIQDLQKLPKKQMMTYVGKLKQMVMYVGKPILILESANGVCSNGKCYNILGIFPHTGKSHFNIFEPLMKALVRKGHNVTVISHFPQKDVLKNYEDISLKGTFPILTNSFNIDGFSQSNLVRHYEFLRLLQMGQENCENVLTSHAIESFLKDNRKFDLTIIEYFFNDCFLGIAYKFKAPIVGITTSVMLSWNDNKLGNPSNPAYIPNHFMNAPYPMTFFDRVETTIANIVQDIIYNYYFVGVKNQEVAKKVFGNDLPPLCDIARNVTLMLLNSHFSLNYARPFVPAIIEVGGMHIEKPKQLSKVTYT
ncbi:hypothetical protein FQA39_LY19052 [Lamprigera yunnana]|nr:hypothetical protein FQA39_LY19052 [Lamprigera yunnana]